MLRAARPVIETPDPRENERAVLIEYLSLTQHWGRVADASESGFVEEGLRERFGEQIDVISTEVTADVARGSCDGVTCLGALHQFEEKASVFTEWARLTRSRGRLAVADVAWGTGVADFLHLFVHEFSPGGYRGYFFEPGEVTTLMMHAGFASVDEMLRPVHWIFEDRAAMIDFCRERFSIRQATPAQVGAALEEFIGVTERKDGRVALRWNLLFAGGERI